MNTLKIIFCALVTIILWSSAYVGIRYGLHGLTPSELGLMRYLTASIVMLFLYLRIPNKHKVTWRDLPQFLLMGILGIGLYNIALNSGELTVSAGLSSFIIGLMPIFTMIWATLFLREHITKLGWMGVLVSLLGLGIIALSSQHDTHLELGIVEIFTATISCSIYVTMQKAKLKRFSPIEITAFIIWSGTLFLLFFAPHFWSKLAHLPLSISVDAIYMGIFPGAIAYISWSYVISQLPASRAVGFLYALPLVTTIMGYFVLHERPALLALSGGVIALLGAVIVNIQKSKQIKPAATVELK